MSVRLVFKSAMPAVSCHLVVSLANIFDRDQLCTGELYTLEHGLSVSMDVLGFVSNVPIHFSRLFCSQMAVSRKARHRIPIVASRRFSLRPVLENTSLDRSMLILSPALLMT